VKFSLPLALLAALALTACNTIENRRSLYTYEKVYGPYTRQWEEESWNYPPNSVDQQYRKTQWEKRRPKIIEKTTTTTTTKPTVAPADTAPAN
jgi:hypothetical protein